MCACELHTGGCVPAMPLQVADGGVGHAGWCAARRKRSRVGGASWSSGGVSQSSAVVEGRRRRIWVRLVVAIMTTVITKGMAALGWWGWLWLSF